MTDESRTALREHVPGNEPQTVIAAESELLGIRSADANALAISGGGIRSASFGLGVMQALVNGKVMPHIHYLSTVSGGGYLGSSLTWFLKERSAQGGTAGTLPHNFPFGTRDSSRVGHKERRNLILDYIRTHANYLIPSGALGLASFAAVVLRAMLVSLTVYVALLTAVLTVLVKLRFFKDTVPRALGLTQVPNLFLLIGLFAVTAFVIFSLAFSVATRIAGDNEYAARTWAQKVFGWTTKTVILCLAFGALPLLHHLVQDLAVIAAAGASSTVIGSALGFVEFLRQQRSELGTNEPGPLAAAGPVLGAGLVLYGLALGAYCLAVTFVDGPVGEVQLALVAVVAMACVLGVVVNINRLGLHRMYRDRLMELFLPDSATVLRGRWALARNADGACIDGFCQRDGAAVLPYHLINTNVVMVDSQTASLRGRGGDNFIASPLYCGSSATGWQASTHYMKARNAAGLPTGRGLTLPTAMAVSGAAINPNAGVGGRGTTRMRIVSTLLSLLNLRLGYWAPNPGKVAAKGSRGPVPNFLEPGLRGGVLGGGLHEDASMVELTDGGHFENLAVYELIRRQVKHIFVCDAGQDGDFTFEDLSNLTERVRVDFGVKIDFDSPPFGLQWVKPGTATDGHGAMLPASALAARGFAIARIRYADDPRDAPSGVLIYFKSTLTPELSADLYGYKRANPAFPHESTGDQFFDELQFEAYRELGYHLGWQFLESNERHAFWSPPAPSAPPARGVGQGVEASTAIA